MKKTIVLIVLLHLTLSSISQTASNDSVTCVPNSKLRKAIKQIEDCKILKEELTATQNSVVILENKVELKNQIIKNYEGKDSLSGVTIKNLQSIIDLKDKVINNGKAIQTIQSIKIRTIKINKWLYGGAGLLIGILVKVISK